MGFLLLGLFIGIPLIEIAVFIQVGDQIGLWSTIGLVILTAVIGTMLLRQQGIQTLMRAQAHVAQNNLPAQELFDGVCLLFAGALLLTPGFVTDSVGFLLLIPAFRIKMGRALFQKLAQSGRFKANFHTHNATSDPSPSQSDAPIIDADFEDLPPKKDSPWHNSKD